MNALLQPLAKTKGILGFAAFDAAGQCLFHALEPPYDPVLLAEAHTTLSSALDIFAAADMPPSTLEVDGTHGRLLLCKVEAITLILLIDANANMNMVHVAINVVIAKLHQQTTQQQVNPASPAHRSVNQPLSPAFNPTLSTSLTSASLPPPPDAVGRPTLQSLLNLLFEYIGPAARVVLRDALDMQGATASTLRREQLMPLVSTIAHHIQSPDRRQAFLNQCSHL